MIHRERRDGAAAAPCPGVGEQRQRHAVGAAGNRDGKTRLPLEGAKPIEPSREFFVAQGRDVAIPIGGPGSGPATQALLLGT
jgi:hypothetical protein